MQYEPAAAREGIEKKRTNQEYEKYYINVKTGLRGKPSLDTYY
jgi:hypothetical protein